MGLTEHYKAVRARLNAGPRILLPAPPPPEPPPPPPPPPDMAEAHRIIDAHPDDPPWRRIMRDVCQAHGITREELISKRKTANLLAPRHEAYYRLRVAGYSLKRIANLMGGRDHTTVVHGVKVYAERNRIPRPTVPARPDKPRATPRGAACASCPFIRSNETEG